MARDASLDTYFTRRREEEKRHSPLKQDTGGRRIVGATSEPLSNFPLKNRLRLRLLESRGRNKQTKGLFFLDDRFNSERREINVWWLAVPRHNELSRHTQVERSSFDFDFFFFPLSTQLELFFSIAIYFFSRSCVCVCN